MVPAIRNKPTMTAWTAPMNRMEGLFDRLFDDALFAPGFRSGQAALPVALWQDDDNIYVEADVPGMTEQDVEVTVHKGVLTIRASRKPEEGRTFVYNDRTWGRYERAITLPDAVNADAVEADLSHGVLRLTLPKSPETKPRKIALRTS